MIHNTSDNILDVLKVLKEQKLNYVLAIFEPNGKSNEKDFVNIYTSFENQGLNKLVEVLKEAKQIKEEPKIKVKNKKEGII